MSDLPAFVALRTILAPYEDRFTKIDDLRALVRVVEDGWLRVAARRAVAPDRPYHEAR